LIWEFSWSKTKNLNTVVETKMSGVEIFKMLILIWEFSWSKTKNLNTVVETKMSGVEIFKMFESDLSDNDMHF
jgi:hypothetical protein